MIQTPNLTNNIITFSSSSFRKKKREVCFQVVLHNFMNVQFALKIASNQLKQMELTMLVEFSRQSSQVLMMDHLSMSMFLFINSIYGHHLWLQYQNQNILGGGFRDSRTLIFWYFSRDGMISWRLKTAIKIIDWLQKWLH